MYKRMYKKIIVISLAIVLFLTVLLLPACKKAPQESSFSARMEGAALTWDAYEGAASYSVRCSFTDKSGYSIKVTDLSYIYPYTMPGDYVFSVSALDENGKVLATTKEITYHLGTGEAADAITIGSADDLMGITESVSISFGKTSVTTPVYYRLTADIDLTGKKFTPIGTSGKPFYSVFDGNGHTIKGLNFTECNTDGNMGLFGYTKYAVIKNLTLEGSLLFDENSKTKSGELNCGLLIGHSISTLVDNCHVKGNLEVLTGVITTNNYTLNLGGVIGKAESGRISGVSYEGNVKGQYGKVYAGGILGHGQGDLPDFMLLNSKSVANVEGVATSYNVSTGTSYAYAFCGVLAGNISYAGRLASLLAIGSASASTTKDGTPVDNILSGVFGRTAASGGAPSLTMYNIYYVDTIPKVVGNATKDGSYASYIHALSEAQLKDKENYNLDEGRYGLDFENYWDIAENDFPELRKTPMQEQPSLLLTVASEVKDHVFSYDFVLEDLSTSSYFDYSAGKTTHALGYKLDTVLEKINAGVTSLHDENTIASGVSVKISAEGIEDRILTTKKSSLNCYLQYGVCSNYESKPDIFGGYKIVNAIKSTNVETYDYTGVNHITITFLPTDGTEG